MFEDLKKLFIKEHGNYAKNLQFQSLAIIVVIMIVFTKYFPKTYGFIIILLVFAFFISNYVINVKNTYVNDLNHITMVKLQLLQDKVYQHINEKINVIKASNSKNVLANEEIKKMYDNNKLDSLYIDANMIHFLESIISLYDYNSYTFFSLLKGTNNILRLKKEIDEFYEANKQYPINISQMLENALELKSKTLNNIHNFIYSIPKSNVMFDYVNKITDRYNVLISRITDSIHSSYIKSINLNGINTTTQFVSYNTTKPYDPKLNHSITPTSDNKLIDYYI
jgi:hypothetical protein